jgi:hypothetical protein
MAWGNGYTYRTTAVIAASQVTGTLTDDLSALVSLSSTNLKTVANGGSVQNTVTQTGLAITIPADFLVTSDAAGSTQITGVDFEAYDPVGGTALLRVRVPGAVVGKTIYIFYDNASVTTQQGTPTNAYDSNYLLFWHFQDNAANTNVLDSTSNGRTGTSLLSNTNALSAPGKVGLCFNFAGTSTQALSLASATALNAYPITISLWCKYSENHADIGGIFGKYTGNSLNGWSIHTNGGKTLAWFFTDGTASNCVYPGGDGMSYGTGLNDSAWHHYAFVVNSSGGAIYLDGTQVGSTLAWTGTAQAPSSTELVRVASLSGVGGGFLSASSGVANCDEARLCSSARSAAYIGAEYNNENAPLTFWTLTYDQLFTSSGYGPDQNSAIINPALIQTTYASNITCY